MKRRAISFLIVLALCLSLCPIRVLAADVEDPKPTRVVKISADTTDPATFVITDCLKFDTMGHTYTVLSGRTAVSVQSSGGLYLTTGTIEYTGGSGIEVCEGGFLCVDDPGMKVIGAKYGLEIASGATVRLSGGTFEGDTAAIQAADYSALLVSGYAYFDGDGKRIQLYDGFDGNGNPTQTAAVAGEQTVTVKECTDHSYIYKPDIYDPDTDTRITHSGICQYCGAPTPEPEQCTFNFNGNGNANCEKCGHTIEIEITIDENSLVYDGTSKPASGSVAVTVTLNENNPLTDGTTLTEEDDYDYTVSWTPGTNAGEEITVTVTGKSYDGAYMKTFHVVEDTPEITWDTTTNTPDNLYPLEIDYMADKAALTAKVKEVLLRRVQIETKAPEDLKGELKFSYSKDDGINYTVGLPTDAGTYKIIAGLPKLPNYNAVPADEDNPVTLTIKQISPFADLDNDVPQAAKDLEYNRTAQNLVTPGKVWDGAVILYALGKLGEGGSVSAPDAAAYSTTIPTGTDADTYYVYYKVEGSDNYDYNVAEAAGCLTVKIEPKEITPVVELEYYSCVYDGAHKQPKVTVKDGTITLEKDTEYEVTYINNQNAGKAKVIVSTKDGSNYTITENALGKDTTPKGFAVEFEITPKDQAGLTITGQPGTVTYGDQFTLGTSGGTGNGTVTWKITAVKDGNGNAVASDDFNQFAVVEAGGQVTVKGVGTVTVQATRSDAGTDGNHKDATATWTFISVKKHVTATVTAANKTYNGDVDTTVTAVVEQSDLAFPDDKITITGPNGDTDPTDTDLAGTFSDGPNAGTSKTVTVGINQVKITVNNEGPVTNGEDGKFNTTNYVITVPDTTKADITKATTEIRAKPTMATPTYIKDTPQALLTEGAKAAPTTNVATSVEAVQVEYSLYADGPWRTDIPTATDAGTYQVWYRVKESDNYIGTAAAMVEVTINPKTVNDPAITLDPESFVYDGTEKKPTVTVKYSEEKDGKTTEIEIPSSEYTVTYSNNVNVGKAEDTTNPPTVTVTDKDGGNYTVATVTKTFEITKSNSAVLTKSPEAKNLTYNGQAQNLVTVGTATGGKVVYALAKTNDKPAGEAGDAPAEEETGDEPADGAYSTTIPQGKAAGLYKVYYKVEGDDNHEDTDPAYVFVTIYPKTVISPVIQFEVKKPNQQGGQEDAVYLDTYSVEYNGGPQQPVVIVKDGNTDLTGEYDVTYSNNTNAGTATVHIIDKSGGNYIVNGSKTFTIEKATASFTTLPQSVVSEGQTLTYSGKAQTLIKAGVANGGTAVYTLDDKNGPYFETLPTGTVAGDYKVYAKVRGDANHVDSEVKEIEVTIGVNTVTNPKVELSPTSFQYNGNEQKPTITVKDEKGNVIPENEYDVTYERVMDDDAEATEPEPTEPGPVKIIDAGTYKITITSKANGNYSFTQPLECTFTITPANQAALTITGKPTVVCYGDKFMLSAVGGLGDGEITWSTGNQGIASINPSSGLVEVTGVGTVTITATKAASTDGNYEAATATWIVTTLKAAAAVATPPIAKTGLVYDTTEQGLLDFGGTTVKGIGTVKYCLSAVGTYSAAIPKETNAGTYKVWYKVEDDTNWTGTAPAYVEVTIARKEVKADDLTVKWDNNAEEVEGVKIVATYVDDNGTTKTIARSEYTAKVNTPDWEENEWITVEVTAKEKGNYKFNLTALIEHTPSGGEYNDSDDLDDPGIGGDDGPSIGNPGVSSGDRPGIEETASTQTTVRDGAASTTVSAAAGNRLVNEAVANRSENVVIKPEITGDVTRAEVSLPASAVRRIGNETDASLTVSTPIADVTIPNGALDALSGAGGTVSVAAEQVDNTVVLTLTAGGKDVGDIPGGLTLTVPTEDAGPGTVAVLIYEDGTREIIRKSVADDGGVRIPLNGSATVAIVDNSREFTDVPAESWAAGAVAFASAHEMFNGTSETTFSPELSMSRAMLATVLHNLESNPDTAFNGAFADVEGDTWYAESVSWAANRGIVTGYGNGSFGANDSITREQLAVMLWRYAGSPTADEQALDFTDAGQASDYATEALAWAAANGILNGYGDGRIDPTGLATRAQAAQMLKNFMENT